MNHEFEAHNGEDPDNPTVWCKHCNRTKAEHADKYAAWEERLTLLNDLVAKGYSTDVPRWEISSTLRAAVRDARQEGNEEVLDRLFWLTEEWNRKP
jgi:hypothetical protein